MIVLLSILTLLLGFCLGVLVHITHEGQALRLGLNIGWSFNGWNRIWIRFIWAWADLSRKVGIKYNFRIRFFHWPHIFVWTGRTETDLIEDWVTGYDLVVMTREMAEDFHIPRGLCLYNRGFVGGSDESF